MNSEKMEETLLLIQNGISEIKVDLGKINTKLDADYRAIHGNGRPGLMQQVADQQVRIARLEEKNASRGTLWIVLGFILNAAVSLAALFK